MLDRDVKDFAQLLTSGSSRRPPRPSTKQLDPLAIPPPKNSPFPHAPFVAGISKTLKQLPIPSFGSHREQTLLGGPQRAGLFVSNSPFSPLIIHAANNQEAESSTAAVASSLGITRGLPSAPALPSRLSKPAFSATTSPHKQLVTPSTTRFVEEAVANMKPKASSHNAPMHKLPAPPSILSNSSDGPDIDPVISRGLGVSPQKNQSRDWHERIGRNKHGFILSVIPLTY